jgi:hypothetical protein
MFADAVLNCTNTNNTHLRAVIRCKDGELIVTALYSADILKEGIKEYTDGGHTFVKFISEDIFNRIIANRNK